MKLFFLSLVDAIFIPVAVSAATVSLSVPAGTYGVLEPVPVSVFLNTGSDPVNAASIAVKFDPTAADASAPTRAGSHFDVWVAAPRVAGNSVRFEGASTVPFTGVGKIGEFTVTPTREGTLTPH